jgi:hypothetical protein
MADNHSKPCTKCKAVKPLSEFYFDKRVPGGHQSECKTCARLTMKAYRLRPENRKANIERCRRWNEAHPESENHPRDEVRNAEYEQKRIGTLQLAARRELHKALNRGDIVRPPICSQCGSAKSTMHGHHDDYSKPLDVRWLCRTCHGAFHRVDLSKVA